MNRTNTFKQGGLWKELLDMRPGAGPWESPHPYQQHSGGKTRERDEGQGLGTGQNSPATPVPEADSQG